jgi:hypothetical protein
MVEAAQFAVFLLDKVKGRPAGFRNNEPMPYPELLCCQILLPQIHTQGNSVLQRGLPYQVDSNDTSISVNKLCRALSADRDAKYLFMYPSMAKISNS